MPIATTVNAGNWFSNVDSVVTEKNRSEAKPKKATIATSDSRIRFSAKKRTTRDDLAKAIPHAAVRFDCAPEAYSLNAAARMSSWRHVPR